MPKSRDLYKQRAIFAIMFNVGGNVFPHKNAIIKNTREKTSYLSKIEYRTFKLENT